MEATLKQLSQGAALCGVPTGIGSVDLLGNHSPGEVLPPALALAAFVGAGVWMFWRWGKSPVIQAPTETPAGTAKDPQTEREVINV